MDDFPVKKLQELTSHFGTELLRDVDRCEELLTSSCSNHRSEVNALIAVLREWNSLNLWDTTKYGVVPYNETLMSRVQGRTKASLEDAEWAFESIKKTLYISDISDLLVQNGYKIEEYNDGRSCNMIVSKENIRIAINLKNHAAKCNVAQIEQFGDFIKKNKLKVTHGFFFTTSNYAKSSVVYLESCSDLSNNLSTFILEDNNVMMRSQKLKNRLFLA